LSDIQAKGEYLLAGLREIKENKTTIVDVRGKGLAVGIEFAESIKADDVSMKLLDAGFVTITAKHNTLRLVPPLVITMFDIDKLLTHFKSIIY
jgi:acetylornithine/succinyldiaminopimelate/putrescine aminotransferase